MSYVKKHSFRNCEYEFDLQDEWGIVDTRYAPSLVNYRLMLCAPFTAEEIAGMPTGVISEKTFEMSNGFTLTVTASVVRA